MRSDLAIIVALVAICSACDRRAPAPESQQAARAAAVEFQLDGMRRTGGAL